MGQDFNSFYQTTGGMIVAALSMYDASQLLEILKSLEKPKYVKLHIQHMKIQGLEDDHKYANGIARGAEWGWDCCVLALEDAISSWEG